MYKMDKLQRYTTAQGIYSMFYNHVLCLVAQLCMTLRTLPGSFVQGDSPARILEWDAVPSSRGSSQPRDRMQLSHIEGGFFTF